VRVNLYLRSRQIQYLEYLAERHECALSHAVGRIVGRARQTTDLEVGRPAQKECRHFSLDQTHIGFIDLLAAKWGVNRSEVARRLIDDALARDQSI
jgi:hypothetical protein